MQTFVRDEVNAEAYVAGKAAVQRCMCDAVEALEAGCANRVPAEMTAKTGLEGVQVTAL